MKAAQLRSRTTTADLHRAELGECVEALTCGRRGGGSRALASSKTRPGSEVLERRRLGLPVGFNPLSLCRPAGAHPLFSGGHYARAGGRRGRPMDWRRLRTSHRMPGAAGAAVGRDCAAGAAKTWCARMSSRLTWSKGGVRVTGACGEGGPGRRGVSGGAWLRWRASAQGWPEVEASVCRLLTTATICERAEKSFCEPCCVGVSDTFLVASTTGGLSAP